MIQNIATSPHTYMIKTPDEIDQSPANIQNHTNQTIQDDQDLSRKSVHSIMTKENEKQVNSKLQNI